MSTEYKDYKLLQDLSIGSTEGVTVDDNSAPSCQGSSTLNKAALSGGRVTAEGSKGKPEVLVDVVGSPKSTEDFPGLYLGALPETPFLGTAWLQALPCMLLVVCFVCILLHQ